MSSSSYKSLENLSIKYKNDNFKILCFPCNDFGFQEPSNINKIQNWLQTKYPNLNCYLFDKISVNGNSAHPVFKYLKNVFPGRIQWNWSTQWIVDKHGIPIKRFDMCKWNEIDLFIEQLLKQEL